MDAFPKFLGNCPRNVSRDAKYGVRSGVRGPVVSLIYRSSTGERWLATTEDHPELAEMVNAVKQRHSVSQYGPFYINEYKQVLVPVSDREYYLAGEYERPLVFDFEGHRLSGDAVNLAGQRLQPGDDWDGPHPGIPYRLASGGGDIYYDVEVRPNVTRRVSLSDVVGRERAALVAARIAQFKGWAGGRFYVNEWRTMFAPIKTGGDVWKYIYLGHLAHDDDWFPKPPILSGQ